MGGSGWDAERRRSARGLRAPRAGGGDRPPRGALQVPRHGARRRDPDRSRPPLSGRGTHLERPQPRDLRAGHGGAAAAIARSDRGRAGRRDRALGVGDVAPPSSVGARSDQPPIACWLPSPAAAPLRLVLVVSTPGPTKSRSYSWAGFWLPMSSTV